ncbi:hypothetical protein AAVH_13457 [Aphelenchoides avenae]|nr:hypothetical protein AAVH_13457 [Aphelenchus avenae]
MSCKSVTVTYSVPPKTGLSSFANTTFPSLAPKSKAITKHTHKSCTDFPKALCHQCRQLFDFKSDGFIVPCMCKLKGEICYKCKNLDLVKAIFDFAGEIGVSKCNSGYTPVAPFSKDKMPLHVFLCELLRCGPDNLIGHLHIKNNYALACRSVKRRQLTCKYLDDTYILEFARFTYNGAGRERMSDGSGATIARYLQEKRNIILEHPQLPCLVTRGKPYKYPLECVLVDLKQ